MTVDNEGLLSRWSRRKLQSKEVTLQEDQLLEQTQDLTQNLPRKNENQPSAEAETETVAPLLTDDDMPDIDSLHEGSDFSQFMSSGVSDRLRNLALKKMFQAPEFNIRDGLDDFDEDYTTFEALGNIITSDMKHQIELEAQKQLAAEINAVDAESASGSVSDAENSIDPTAIDPTEVDITETDITIPDTTEETESAEKLLHQLAATDQPDPLKFTVDNKQDNE